MTVSANTVIVGGGQGGLSANYYLTQQARKHIILERGDRAAERWPCEMRQTGVGGILFPSPSTQGRLLFAKTPITYQQYRRPKPSNPQPALISKNPEQKCYWK